MVGVGILRCSDISLGGMYLETVNEFNLGSTLTLRFRLAASDPKPLEIQARVTYVHPNVGIGLSFQNLPPELIETIRRHLDHF